MNWIKGKPKAEGKYLTIMEYDLPPIKTYSDPKVCEFKYVRCRLTNELFFSDEGQETCWVKNGVAQIVDYYMPIPENPTLNN
tara:strand:+ start:16 stop:261 length:246 start_codon:yes stop_codon:yes gene_type:complete